jgi:cellulose synthase/poly-beta-1,6-N-acetylglucosamine synthase-like glycosyltransferase
VRAISRTVYKEIQFPNTSANDVYPYLFAKKKGYGFVAVPEALIYYRLPTTMADYVKQMKRFLKSRTIQERHFDKDLVRSEFVITPQLKFRIFLKHFLKNPVWVSMYFCYHLIPTILYRFDLNNVDGMWTIIMSTKDLA